LIDIEYSFTTTPIVLENENDKLMYASACDMTWVKEPAGYRLYNHRDEYFRIWLPEMHYLFQIRRGHKAYLSSLMRMWAWHPVYKHVSLPLPNLAGGITPCYRPKTMTFDEIPEDHLPMIAEHILAFWDGTGNDDYGESWMYHPVTTAIMGGDDFINFGDEDSEDEDDYCDPYAQFDDILRIWEPMTEAEVLGLPWRPIHFPLWPETMQPMLERGENF
jgi:hypothetical protein